eukprot:278166-Amorphochlora_amoeboformis.AAC.1
MTCQYIIISSYIYLRSLEIAQDPGDTWRSSHPVVTGLRGGVTKRDVTPCHTVDVEFLEIAQDPGDTWRSSHPVVTGSNRLTRRCDKA